MIHYILDFVQHIQHKNLVEANKSLIAALNYKVLSLLEQTRNDLIDEMSMLDFSKISPNPLGAGKKEQEIKDNITKSQSGNGAIFINRSKEDLVKLISQAVHDGNYSAVPFSSHYKLKMWKASVDEV